MPSLYLFIQALNNEIIYVTKKMEEKHVDILSNKIKYEYKIKNQIQGFKPVLQFLNN